MTPPMDERRKEKHPIEELVHEVEFRQRNTTWPNAKVNASGVDKLLWKGSRRITKIQRAGVAIFGLLFILSGISAISLSGGFWIDIFISTGFIFVGCKLIWNSIRRNDPQTERLNDE